MPIKVTEGGRRRVLQSRPSDGVRWIIRAVTALAMSVSLSTGAAAQEAAQEDTAFTVKVLDMSGAYQRITVPLHQSAIIETSIEVSRADVVAGDIVDVQPVSATQLLITGKKYGRTNVVLWDKSDQQYLLDVSVELDLEALSEAISALDPQADVHARSVQGNIVLYGTATSAARAERMTELAKLFLPPKTAKEPGTLVQNHLDIAGEQQVLLRCVVAEVSRTAARELGVNGFLAGENFRDMFLINQIGGINSASIGVPGGFPVTENLPFVTESGGIGLGDAASLSLGFPRVQTQLFIRAMADNAVLRILAEPNLVAISGETATFLAGGEFPIPVPQGNQQVTIEFRKFGVRLNFTPVVLDHQRIRLRVAPEVSDLDTTNAVQIEGFVVPGLSTRSAETTVEIMSGQTFAIAGLLNERIRGLSTQLPGLGDLPVLGALFRSVQYRRSQTELVILVTAEIVAPLDRHQTFPLPGDEVTDPSDFELYALGLIDGGLLEDSEEHSDEADGSEPDELSIHGPFGHESPSQSR